MSITVTVIDYGLGNLFSVSRAFEQIGAQVQLADSAQAIDSATHLVLPGVGAFQDGMAGLQERGLVGPLRRYGASGRPLVGICLGMQLLFHWSEEFGRTEGLGLIPGTVAAIPSTGADGRTHKIPHIGWNELRLPAGRASWAGTMLEAVSPGTAVYFVHSFSCVPSESRDRLADCEYDGRLICAAVQRGPISGFQFHPEKSGGKGLRILAGMIPSVATA
jgi:glutamine amidotransferase